MHRIYKILRTEAAILLICLIALIMRLWGLGFQSLWLDELQTMNETNPALGWGEMFSFFKTGEHHPPLFFIIERLFFTIFGHTASIARLAPAIAGVLGVWAIYRLGQEILSRQLGILCAVLTCVNYFCISYSQEARPYSFAFLFATLSFTWFIRLLKDPSKRNLGWYSVFSLLLLYTHYYSLFVIAAQVILALLFILQEQGSERKKLVGSFLLALLIIVIGYLPWLSYFKANVALRTFWITDVSPAFLQNFFYEYFGNANLLNPLLLFLLFSFFVKVAINAESISVKRVKENSLLLAFTLILFWIFIVLLIPYIRSLLVVPMLYPRYTIVVLPAIILALAFSIELFKQPLVKYSLLGLFVVLSLNHLLFVKKYYTETSKTQFREMTQWVVQENASDLPIINEHTGWQQGYYLRLLGSQAEVFTDKKEIVVDSILHKSSEKYDLEGFWVVGAHGSVKPDTNYFSGLDTAYSLIEQKQFFDAWAQFYASKTSRSGGYFKFLYTDFTDGEKIASQKQVAIWNGAIHAKPVGLKRGDYKFFIRSYGTAAANIFPHLNIYVNDKKIADYSVAGTMTEREFTFQLGDETNAVVRIEMDNDLTIAEKKEDRNAFVESILIKMVR